jgi:hypothetical protein
MVIGLISAVIAGAAQIYVAVGIGDITQPLIQYNPVRKNFEPHLELC